jgi:gamma-glutamyltranspeptidase/glutathione hydrolase
MRVLMNNRSLFKRKTYRQRVGLVVAFLALNGLFLDTSNAEEDIPPELSSDVTEDKFAQGKRFMAVTANPLATEAAYQILKKGGSAVDAAIAAQLVLGLVEPQSSGIGGGAFMLSWAAQQKALKYYDGREVTPEKVDKGQFLRASGEPRGFMDAAVGGKSVGVPGLLRMLELAHRNEGKLPWLDLFESAITLAEDGFLISPRLHMLLSKTPRITARVDLTSYFFNIAGEPYPVGHRLRNPTYARTLKVIAEKGADAFYTAEIASAIVDAVSNDSEAGTLSMSDMANYRAKVGEALCLDYREYKVCGPGPPAGGMTVLQILGMLELFDLSAVEVNSAEMIHLFSEASSLAFSDRGTYLADPDFVSVPAATLIGKPYLQQRSSLILEGSMGEAKPGILYDESQSALPYQSAESPELMSTTHLSIADEYGNMVSMTSSIENAFGSRLMVNGFLLNNQLTDFSFSPTDHEGALVANRIEPLKRPRSSMSPMIIFLKGRPRLLVGSPGGARIIDYISRTIVYHLDKALSIEAAIGSPHIINLNRGLELEAGRISQSTQKALTARGHRLTLRSQSSGIHAIAIINDRLMGAADPRREGTARGE